LLPNQLSVSNPTTSTNCAPSYFALNEHLTLGEYVTPDQLAQHLGVSVRTLSRWHARRIGPPRCSVGKLILYRVTAVRIWMAEREFGPVTPTTRRSAGGNR